MDKFPLPIHLNPFISNTTTNQCQRPELFDVKCNGNLTEEGT